MKGASFCMPTKTALNDTTRQGRLPTVLTLAEQKSLLASPNIKAPTGLRNYALMVLFLNLGLRVSEALNLKIADIDWHTGKVDVIAGKGNRDRVLWVSGHDLALLKKWCEIRPNDSDYLFCTLPGGRLSDRYVRDFVKRYAKKAGIKKRTHPHCLRHSFATDLLRESKNIRLVQKALGHMSLSTTMLYTHIVDEQLETALKQLREDC